MGHSFCVGEIIKKYLTSLYLAYPTLPKERERERERGRERAKEVPYLTFGYRVGGGGEGVMGHSFCVCGGLWGPPLSFDLCSSSPLTDLCSSLLCFSSLSSYIGGTTTRRQHKEGPRDLELA